MDRTDRNDPAHPPVDDDRMEARRDTRDLATDDRPELVHDVTEEGRADADAGGRRGATGAADRREVDIEGRWQVTQSRFLDSPREAVVAADELVQDVVEDVRRRLDDERNQVTAMWQRDEADTEDLRAAMLRYREVLDRLATR